MSTATNTREDTSVLDALDWEHTLKCESATDPDCPEAASHTITYSCGCPPRPIGPRHVARVVRLDVQHRVNGGTWRCPNCNVSPVLLVSINPLP